MSEHLNEALEFASSIRTKATAAGPDAIAVDPLFEEDPKAAKILEFGIKRRKNVLIVGDTGCGKSSLAINVAARLGEKIEPCNLDGETSTGNLIGDVALTQKDGQTVTQVVHGAALRAYKDGKILLLEEVDFANPDILASLHRLMETQSGFYVCNVGGSGEIIKRHPLYCVVATANTIGTGEDSFVYSGTKPLNQAFMNRFSLTVRMDYLPADKEAKVVAAKSGLKVQLAKDLVDCAVEVRTARKSASNRQLTATISTRDLIEWAGLINGTKFNPLEAAEFCFLNRINEADRDVIVDFIKNRIR